MTGVRSVEVMLHTPGPWEVMQGFACEAIYSLPLASAGKRAPCQNGAGDYPVEGLVALAYGHHQQGKFSLSANQRLIAASPEMLAVLDELEDAFDQQIYPQQKTQDFDASDDHEYTVNITAKQWRAIGRVLAKALRP